jgi:hypothetical protein
MWVRCPLGGCGAQTCFYGTHARERCLAMRLVSHFMVSKIDLHGSLTELASLAAHASFDCFYAVYITRCRRGVVVEAQVLW